MFVQLAAQLGVNGVPNLLTTFRTADISEYLEAFWNAGRIGAFNNAMGVPGGAAAAHQAMARTNLVGVPAVLQPAVVAPTAWHHLAYAYLLENTRVVDIFRRVVREWTHGERLPPATVASQRWLQVTEQLFFQDAWPYSVRAVTSTVRPSAESTRRGSYYRLIGMDLNHPPDDAAGQGYVKADAANRDFAAVFEALLTEVWKGFANLNNFAAQNDTDDSAIINLVRRLREMLLSRRLNATLSREEYDAVALLSWLHVTLDPASPVVQNLAAQAEGFADRLKQIGDLVGLPSHARSDAYFQLAEPVSRVLRGIEANAAANWPLALYAGMYQADMLQIITHWSIATGRDLKERPTRTAAVDVLASSGAGRAGMGTSAPGGRVVPLPR